MTKREDEELDPWKRDVEKVVGYRDGQWNVVLPPSDRPLDNAKATDSAATQDGWHVFPNQRRGGWDVLNPDAARSSEHFTTQEGAVQRAREIVSRAGSGEVIVHGPNSGWRRNVRKRR